MNVKKPERCIEPIFWLCPLCEYFIKLLVWANLKHSEFTRNMTSGTVDNPTDSLEFTQFIQCMTAVTQMSSNSSSGTSSALSEWELVIRGVRLMHQDSYRELRSWFSSDFSWVWLIIHTREADERTEPESVLPITAEVPHTTTPGKRLRQTVC